MDFRARKVSGAFEKQASELLDRIFRVKIFLIHVFRALGCVCVWGAVLQSQLKRSNEYCAKNYINVCQKLYKCMTEDICQSPLPVEGIRSNRHCRY